MHAYSRNLKICFWASISLLLAGCGEKNAEHPPVAKSCPTMPVVPTLATLSIPTISITTEGSAPIISKDDYLNANMIITGEAADAFDGPIQIRGRGNSTWEMPKKPYKIKLPEKQSLLGMPSDKEWALLANYSDKTQLRNDLAFNLSQGVGLTYTPRSRYVEVTLNGDYVGLYQLVEQIKVAKSRVNIKELKPENTSESDIAGGYLLEINYRKDDDFCFTSTRGLSFCLKSPDEPNEQQLAYIQNYFQTIEDSVFSDTFSDPATGYAQYFDTDSMIKWYLVNEIFKNHDAQFGTSVFLYKDRVGKTFMGPVWDYDIAAGNVNYDETRYPEGWWIRKASIVTRLFEDPAFASQVRSRWCSLKSSYLPTLQAHIDERAYGLNEAAGRNFSRWDILGKYVWPNTVVTGSYEGEVNCLKYWLDERIRWMDQQFTTEYGACPI